MREKGYEVRKGDDGWIIQGPNQHWMGDAPTPDMEWPIEVHFPHEEEVDAWERVMCQLHDLVGPDQKSKYFKLKELAYELYAKYKKLTLTKMDDDELGFQAEVEDLLGYKKGKAPFPYDSEI